MLFILSNMGVVFPGVWMRSRAERGMPKALSALEEVKSRKAGVAASPDISTLRQSFCGSSYRLRPYTLLRTHDPYIALGVAMQGPLNRVASPFRHERKQVFSAWKHVLRLRRLLL